MSEKVLGMSMCCVLSMYCVQVGVVYEYVLCNVYEYVYEYVLWS